MSGVKIIGRGVEIIGVWCGNNWCGVEIIGVWCGDNWMRCGEFGNLKDQGGTVLG